MSEIVFIRDLLSRLMEARDALVAYIQRRRAQGNISVIENESLRDRFLSLAREIRGQSAKLNALSDSDAHLAIHHVEEALSAVALCLMSGRYDCPSYIAVNVDKLEQSLTVLNDSLHSLSECVLHAQV